MSYCSQADYEARFGEQELIQLTDREFLGVVDAAVLTEAQKFADSDIDKRLRMKGWQVPLTDVSEDIKAIALDFTRFYLFINEKPKEVQDAFDRRSSDLDKYVAGKIMLDIGNPNTTTATAGDVDFYQRDPVFSADGLQGF